MHSGYCNSGRRNKIPKSGTSRNQGNWGLEVRCFHLSRLFCDLPAANREDIHTPQMPWLTISDLAVNRTGRGTTATDDDFLGLASGIGISVKPRRPESHDIDFSSMRFPFGAAEAPSKTVSSVISSANAPAAFRLQAS